MPRKKRPTPTPERRWIRAAEVCLMLDITPKTLRRWEKSGAFMVPYLKEGSTVRYALADVEAWIEKRSMSRHERERIDRLMKECEAEPAQAPAVEAVDDEDYDLDQAIDELRKQGTCHEQSP